MDKLDKILFLDFDGPLFSDRVILHHKDNESLKNPTMLDFFNTLNKNGDTFAATCLSYWKMDDCAVNILNKLMQISPFKTVISSSWRELCSLESIQYLFELNGLNLDIHDDWMTETNHINNHWGVEGHDRLIQIKRWIELHKDEICDYVILDDVLSGGSLINESKLKSLQINPERVIIVDHNIGLEHEHWLTLKDILS